MSSQEAMIQVNSLKKWYDTENTLLDSVLGTDTKPVRAVNEISFDISRGETLALVGESGCGKSTAVETMLRLKQPTGGDVIFEGSNIFEMSRDELTEFRKKAQIVFQDPYSSLNPRLTVRKIVREPLDIHGIGTMEAREEKVEEIIEEVGLSTDHLDRYPSEFSGGQRQRISIARALVIEPEFVVLDEPVSALDMTVQAQILNLLSTLQAEYDLTYLVIGHDLGVVRHLADRLAVMYLGQIVELGNAEQIFEEPAHPYTQALIDSVPLPDAAEKERAVEILSGSVPSPRDPPSGCEFSNRCPNAREICTTSDPLLYSNGEELVRCFRSQDEHSYWDSDPLSNETD